MGTKLHQRTFALMMAVLFLATSVAFSAAVVIELRGGDDGTVNSELSSEQLKELTDSLAANNPEDTNNETQETTLKGTKLENFEPTEVTELTIIDTVEGTGDVVVGDATVEVHYTGAYAVNGEIFESSKDSGSTISFPLSQVIKGWTDGVPGMKVGGTRRLIIPGPSAYGVAPEGYQPGDGGRPLGTLVFDIELKAIK